MTNFRLMNLAVLTMAGFLSVACNDRYSEGFSAGKLEGERVGYDRGYDDGYADGDEAGFDRAKTYFASADYNSGFTDGKTLGVKEGYNSGYNVGKQEGVNIGYNNGYKVGYDNGYDDGDADGYNRGYGHGYDYGYDDGAADGGAGAYTLGYNNGYNDGYDDGSFDGYDLGYDDGFSDGYDIGYDDGFDDGWGLSVGKSKKLKGYANILSLAHNDIFNYSKIAAPKKSKKGLTVNGKLLLSEVSMTNKDTLKTAAIVEQYLVTEMAKQVQGKFGLSAERSIKVAKASNHFRKFSSKRVLTAEDTNAYASEIIGADFKEISKAFEKSLKGEVLAMNSVLEKAAEKNGTSPENMSLILTKFFM